MLKDKVSEELSRMKRDGIISKVDYPEYSSPVVVVWKGNGDIFICRDYSGTINKVLDIRYHEIPQIKDIFTILLGGERFTVLDLNRMYH